MVDSKKSEQIEKHPESKTKSYQPRRKTSAVERRFRESAGKPFKNHGKRTKKIINDQLHIKLGQFTEEELDAILKKNKTLKSCKPQ